MYSLIAGGLALTEVGAEPSVSFMNKPTALSETFFIVLQSDNVHEQLHKKLLKKAADCGIISIVVSVFIRKLKYLLLF